MVVEIEFMSRPPGKYWDMDEIAVVAPTFELVAKKPVNMPVTSITIYAIKRIRGIKMTTIASKIEIEENFNFDWILRATGRTP